MLKEEVKENKKIDINAAIVLCSILNDYEKFSDSLKKLMIKENNTTNIYRLNRLSSNETIKNVKGNEYIIKFYLQNSSIINKIQKYLPLNEFILDRNQFRAWQMKLNRMNKNSKQKYDNGVRKANDYAKQIQDYAPGMLTARIKQVCDQLQLPITELVNFSSSTYNHFTQQNDIFTKLNERCVTFKNKDNYIDDIAYNETTIPFIESIMVVEHNGKRYVLQRDLYAASKMIYITQVQEKRINEFTGKAYFVKKDVFDNEAYTKWFDEVFYPKHKEYLLQICNELQIGNEINGLILGT